MKKCYSLLSLGLVFPLFATQSSMAGTLVAGGGQWKVRQVNVTNTPNSLEQADIALTGYNSIGEAGVAVAQVDFGEVSDADDFDVDHSFPGLINGENNFAVEVTGEITVTAAGDISFGFFADDQARLRIGGVTVAESAAGNQYTFGTANLAAGVHVVELVYYEGLGVERVELFVATELGTFADFAATTWELLDATSDQSPTGIVASSQLFASNAVAGSVVGALSAVGGAGGAHRFAVAYPLDATPTELVAAGSDWRYFDTGVPLPADWMASTYDDSLWAAAAPAPLGYADAAIVTTIDFGGVGNEKFPAYYFRQPFTLGAGELELVDSLHLRLLRDDGAAVYINGVEVLRSNLPQDPLDNTTLALLPVVAAAERTYFEFEIDASMLVEGANLLAVEVHQAAVTSSDIIFDLSLEYQRRSSLPGGLSDFAVVGNQLTLTVPAGSIPGSVSVPLRATNAYGASFEQSLIIDKGGIVGSSPTAVSIDTDTLPEGGLPGALVGTLSATDADAGDAHRFELVPAGFPDSDAFTISGNQLFAKASFDAAVQSTYDVRVRATDSVGASFDATLQITVTALPPRLAISPDTLPENAQEFAAVGTLSTVDPLSGTHTYRLVYPVDPTPVDLVDFGDSWKFLADGSDQGAAWSAAGFNDAAWFEGASPLGYGFKNEGGGNPVIGPATDVGYGPDEDNKYATTYFRTTFEIADPRLVDSLSFDFALDDGAIIYINGVALLNIRAATVDSFDDYTGQGDGGEITNDRRTLVGFFGDLLFAGKNSIAVEVHQTLSTSSDLWLDLEMKATVRAPNGDSDSFYVSGDQLFINTEPGDIPAAAGDTFTVQIESTNGGGEVITEELTITVDPESNNPPTGIALDSTSIDEVQPPGTVVGTLTTTDPGGGPFAYTLVPDAGFPDNAQFAIVVDQLVTAVSLDADDGATRTVRVTTTDGTGLSYSETFVVTVNVVQQVPTAVTLDPATFLSDAVIGTEIGTLTAADGNAADTHTFTFGAVWPDTSEDPILPFGSVWKYRDSGADLGTTWTPAGFDDALWPEGPAELGYGDGDEATVVGFGPDGTKKYATTYFRHTLTGVVSTGGDYQMRVKFDDAAAVYINGVEVFRSGNLPADAVFDTYANGIRPDDNVVTVTLPAGVIVDGDITIAVEIHQANGTSSDISFDLELSPFGANPFPAYFAINGDQLVTDGDFADLGLATPFTFQVPIIADDRKGPPFETLVLVTMTQGGPDIDNDGLPDAWEELHFGAGNLTQGPDDDPDKDGSTNAEEYAAGTAPNDPGDFLQITAIAAGEAETEITWPAKAGYIYSLFYSDGLDTWKLLAANLTVLADGDLSGTDPGPLPAARSYRVEADIVVPD